MLVCAYTHIQKPACMHAHKHNTSKIKHENSALVRVNLSMEVHLSHAHACAQTCTNMCE